MKSFSNECGARNGLGYYDYKLNEIVLRRPCFKKSELTETESWFDMAAGGLKKFYLGLGAADNFVSSTAPSNVYTAARKTIKQDLLQNAKADVDMLKSYLQLLEGHTELRNISIKCFSFTENDALFKLLIKCIREHTKLVYLDLTGCYFSDEQLSDLASAIAESYICQVIWPEPRMSQMVIQDVYAKLENNKSLVVLDGVPFELQALAVRNRKNLFDVVRRPSAVGEKEEQFIKEYAESFRQAVAYEKEKLVEMEKTIEVAIIG